METVDAFQIIRGDGYAMLKITGLLSPPQVRDFESEIIPALIQPEPVHFIINCEHQKLLTQAWLRLVTIAAQQSKKARKDARFILVSSEVKKEIVDGGMDHAIKICSNLTDALIDLGLLTRKSMDVAFVNPFLDSAIRVFKIQASTEVHAQKIFLKTDSDRLMGDISGVIGIVSDSFSGAVVISFPEQTFLRIISKMLGEECHELNLEVAQGVGELANIIFGQAKKVLNERGYGIQMALPSVVTGRGHTVTNLSHGPVVVVPFESEAGPFFIEICSKAA